MLRNLRFGEYSQKRDGSILRVEEIRAEVEMPKKMGVNSKAQEARGKKAEVEAEKKVREEKEKEESYWKAMEGPKSKASKKKEEDAEKKAEVLAKRAEAKRLADVEEKELEKMYGKKKAVVAAASAPAAPPKVTAAELAREKEMERKRMEIRAELSRKKESRVTEADEYERLVVVENVNRDPDIIEAHSVEEAIVQMRISDGDVAGVDRHPEKRAKASYKAFEETELAKLKAEKPGLTLNQYKDVIWKMWKKSPDNPLNYHLRE